MARNPKVELRGHEGQVVHPITDGDCVIFPSGETLSHKLSEQEEVMYAPEVTNSSPMFKVGEGDSSDYSANVLDGAYQEAVLKGQTYVNTIQEPSADVITLPTPFTEYERTQSKTFTEMQDGTFGLNLVGQSYVNCIQEPSEPSYVALGENLEFQNKKVEYTTDGQIKSAMLNGMTLVNLATHKRFWNGYSTAGEDLVLELKNNTKYMFVMNSLENVQCVSLAGDDWHIHQTLMGTEDNGSYKGELVQKKVFTFNVSSPSKVKKIRILLSPDPTSTPDYQVMLLEYQEGMENWDIPYFEGMQSVTMTTELENVCSRYNSSVAKNGKTFTVGTSSDRCLYISSAATIQNFNFKPNTKYLMQFKISNLNLDGMSLLKLAFSDDTISSGNCLFGEKSYVTITQNGIYRTIVTTTDLINTSSFIVKGYTNDWEESTSTSRTLTISQIMCIEYQNGMENWDLPYFETTQLMKPLKVQSVNKNLVNKNDFIENKMLSWATGHYTPGGDIYAQTSEIYYPIKYSSTYTISGIQGTRHICFYDKDRNVLGFLGNDNTISSLGTQGIGNWTQFCLSQYPNVAYCRISIRGLNEAKQDLSQLQFEESSTATPYTPHQSKTTSALEPITLRAIGNVKDTLDLSTGEYVQRIGEIVLDGSDDERWYTDENVTDDTSILFRIIISNAQEEDSINLLCDKFKSKFCFPKNTGEAIYISFIKELTIRINKDKLSENSVKGFIAYLQQNPIKVQHILANPITRKISLEYPNLQTYTDITHVQSIAMDGTLIPKIFLPSDISYKAMLKPNTSYNVIVDREVIDSTNQLTVNLGGTTANITANRTVVTTPSTLSNETLTFSGKDNRLAKAMLIEGSTLINGDLPHFDGIGDVKLGRVVENLCMSNEAWAGGGSVTLASTQNKIEVKVTKQGSAVAAFPLTKQLSNGKKYFVYSPSTTSNTQTVPIQVSFKRTYNNSTSYAQQATDMSSSGKLIFKINDKNTNPYDSIVFGNHGGNLPVDTTMTIRRPIICEYIDGMENWDWESIGYFTGTKNVGNEFMRIGNKNLFDWNSFKEKIKNESCFTILDNGFKADSSKGNVGNFLRDKYKFAEGIFKENTQYTISFDTTHEGNLYLSPFVAYTDGTYEGITIGGNGKRTLTTAINKTVKLFSVAWSTQANGGKSTLTNIQIEEALSATPYVAHKHNSLHILPNEQIPLTFEQGSIYYGYGSSFDTATNNSVLFRIRTNLLELEPNETYRISCGNKEYRMGIQVYNNSNNGYSDSGWIYGGNDYYVHTTKDVHKMAIVVKLGDNDANITPSVLHQVRLEKVTDVTLRSFGGVKDELDLTRGVYIQRIGEIVLNGLEQWKLCTSAYQPTDTNYINYDLGVDSIKTSAPILCDTIKTRDWTIGSTAINSRSIAGHSTDRILRLCIEKSIAPDVESLKTYLSTNIVKVQYQLRTPIEHKINIPMKNESNQTIAKPNGIFTLPLMHSGDNHVDINTQIYPKVQSRDYISYPVIANNSQLHTVFHNKLGTGNLTVNLCGTSVTSVDGTSKCTITTPSTISQYELRLSGARNKVSNVCVFSGDYMNVNVPYVEGMMNAVNPTVKNYTEDGRENICELSTDEIITLRSLPNGVRDELNLQTGEYIQRIGEVVFDGSTDEEWLQNTIDNTKQIYIANITISDMSKGNDSIYGFAICDKLHYSINSAKNTFKVSGSKNQIIVRISFDLLQQISLNGLIQYLQQNPITVQYQLATPIVKQIDINNFPHSYKDGHVIIENNDPTTSIPAQLTYKCVTNRSGQIQEHTEQVEKQEHEINELEMLILENIRQQQNR